MATCNQCGEERELTGGICLDCHQEAHKPPVAPERGIARREPAPIAMTRGGVELRSLEELYRFASAVVRSGLAPKNDTPEAVMVKVQAGAELGLSPIRSLSWLTAINGRVGIMGDCSKALVRASGVLDGDITVECSGDGESRMATATAKRKGLTAVSRTFSVADAKRAGLWGKAGPWKDYPDRMLCYRAWGFLARDEFSDVLLGLTVAEELADYPAAQAERVAPVEADPVFALAAPEANLPDDDNLPF